MNGRERSSVLSSAPPTSSFDIPDAPGPGRPAAKAAPAGSGFHRAGAHLIDHAFGLLFPSSCPLCRMWHEEHNEMFCAQCRANIDKHRARDACPTCASSVAKYEVAKGRCSRCRGRRLKILAVARVGPYREALGTLLRIQKFRARNEFERVLGGWLTDAVMAAPWRDRLEAVVAVPTHWRRRITRPYHVPDAIGAFVARRLQLPNPPLLRRVRGGPHQIGLSFIERTANVRGAFALRRGYRLSNARLLLIDDVRTSGATLKECAKVLHRGGASEIYGAVLCTADSHRDDDLVAGTA